MDYKFFENWQDYGKNAMAAAKELETINTELLQQLTNKQLELTNTAIEAGTRYWQTLGDVKAYPELLSDNTRMAAEFNEKLMETTRETADILAQSRESYQSWLENNLQRAGVPTTFTLTPEAAKKPARKAA